jgi:hypothetical protein
LFACPLPRGVEEGDIEAESYRCGSEDLDFAGIFLGATLAAVAVVVVALFSVGRARSLPISAAGVGEHVSTHYARPALHGTNLGTGIFTTKSLTLESLISWIVLVSSIVLIATLLPVYSAAPAVVECRFGWRRTAAFLAPATGSNAGWGYAVAVVGGLVVGGVGTCAIVLVGASHGVVTLGSSANVQGKLRAWRGAAVLVLCVVVLAILVGINAGFVLLEESPHTSGPTKNVVALVFALLHELVDHVASPLIVSVVAIVASGMNTAEAVRPSTVFVVSVAVEVANSVLAPVIAQLGASDGCFRDKLFSHPERVETSVELGFCTCLGPGSTTEAGCSTAGCSWFTYQVGVSYTPPFRFDGRRCISSIITVYTPEYLVVFSLRILIYPLGWWLARRGTPWAVTGFQPPVLLRSTFVSTRRHLVRIVTCCFAKGSERDEDVRDADYDNNDTSAPSLPAPARSSSLEASSSSSSSLSLARRSQTDAVLETLHAIEPATHCFNLLVIVTGPGMFSPIVAVAGVASLGCLHLWKWSLDRRFGSTGAYGESYDGGHDKTHNQAPVHAVHPMPLSCVAFLLFINTLYLVMLLSTSQLEWAGWAASAVCWSMFGVSCWRSWDSLSSCTSTSRSRGHVVEVPIELTEMLLPSNHEDADE